MNYKYILPGLMLLFIGCSVSENLSIPQRNPTAITGSEFYKKVLTASREDREKLAMTEILKGNIPSFLKKFVRIDVTINSNSKIIKAHYFVLPDYLSIGIDDDFARIPLTPMTAQAIADSLHCFLPTRKMVNDIYINAKVKLEPVPLLSFRDSALMFWQHHLMIEGERKQRKGLIAGIKKDVVISSQIRQDPKPNRVAIYGWHKPDGLPIQPLYTGHVNWYVDYSHGIRLIWRTIYVDGKAMDYIDVLKDPELKSLLCDEEACDYYRY